MDHTDSLRIVEVVDANNHLCTRIVEEAYGDLELEDEIKATNKLISELKMDFTRKIIIRKIITRHLETKSDDHEYSEHKGTILTPSQSGTTPLSQYKTKHDTLSLGDLIADSVVDVPEVPRRSTLFKTDLGASRDALTTLLKEIAEKGDVAGLLKDIQEDQIIDLCKDARMHHLGKVHAVRMLCKILIKQSDTLQRELDAMQTDLNALIRKATAQNEISASQKDSEALEKPLDSLTLRLASFRARTARLRESGHVMMRKILALPLDDLLHAAGVEEEKAPEVEALLNEFAEWDEDAKKPSRIFASRSSDISNTGAGYTSMGPIMGSEDTPTTAGVGPSTTHQ